VKNAITGFIRGRSPGLIDVLVLWVSWPDADLRAFGPWRAFLPGFPSSNYGSALHFSQGHLSRTG
jgi:hypothetical protein